MKISVGLASLMALACQAPGPTDPGATAPGSARALESTSCTWRAQDSGTTNDLFGVAFVDAKHGWAIGDGLILATSDGGKTWAAQVSTPSKSYDDLVFAGANKGWVVGGGPGAVLATTNGGSTWNVQDTGGTRSYDFVAAIDGNHVWAATGGDNPQLASTADGGLTWDVETINISDGISDIFFADQSHGWAIGFANNHSYATFDGGHTWTDQGLIAVDTFFYRLWFADAQHGWAVGEGVSFTSDGGATWTAQLPNDNERVLGGLSFIDSTHGWSAGGTVGGGVVVSTSDGGDHWDKVIIPKGPQGLQLLDVSFGDSTHGWAVGFAGQIFACLPPAPTALSYDGATTADFGDDAVLAATLTDIGKSPAVPVPGKTVTFTLGAQACTGTTGADGRASCTLTMGQVPGPYAVTATFAGDPDFASSSQAVPFLITREETALSYTGGLLFAASGTASLSAHLTDDSGTPIAGRSIQLQLGSGASQQSCQAITSAGGTAACSVAPVNQALGPAAITATFAGDAFYLPSKATASGLVFAFTDGTFVVGEQQAELGAAVTFWSGQWSSLNSPGAPPAFKGFASSTSTTPPSCGGTWSAGPGNIGHPAATVPAYFAAAATAQITRAGSTISGDIVRMVIVKADPGYSGNPGHAGTG